MNIDDSSFKVYMNDDPRLTLTLFMAMLPFVPVSFNKAQFCVAKVEIIQWAYHFSLSIAFAVLRNQRTNVPVNAHLIPGPSISTKHTKPG